MIWIEWVEPFDVAGNPMYCRVARDVVIAAQKEAVKARKFEYLDDQQALDDFIAVHWAKVIEE